jgi:hypothetical protein
MQPIDGELFKLSLPVSICHALGHVMANVSFAAVAVSFTHTIKGLPAQGALWNMCWLRILPVFF